MMIENRMWKYFQCQQCGTCCATIGLPYDADRIFEIAEHLKMSLDELIEKFYGKVSPDGSSFYFDDSKRTPCPFLSISEEKSVCRIYTVRPEGCRLYPIDTDGGREGVACPAWEIAFAELKKEQEEEI